MPRWLVIGLLYLLVLVAGTAAGLGAYHLTHSLVADFLAAFVVGGVGSMLVTVWVCDTAQW